MRREYFPYYISRAVLSLAFGVFLMGFDWPGLLLAMLFFYLFLIYLHSGWFGVDLSIPLFPLRRDSRGQLIQREALIISIIAGLLTQFALYQISNILFIHLIPGNIGVAVAVLAYFTSQFLLFLKT